MAMGYQGVNSYLEYLNMWGNSIMRKTGFFCSPLARVVLHPWQDNGSQLFSRALKGILHLFQRRRLVTYQQFLELK